MVRYLFIDESGDLGREGSRYLVLSCLIVSDEKPLERIIKNARRHTFKKQLRKACEIKANKSSPDVIKHLLTKLNSVPDARIVYVVLEKKKVLSRYLQDNKHKLYNYVAGKLARYLELEDDQVIMRIDKSKGRQMLQEDFNAYFENNLKQNSKVAKIEIYHSYSQNWEGLQFADLLAWACFQKFERGNDEYIDLITLESEIFHVW